jgi:hypothetical protein
MRRAQARLVELGAEMRAEAEAADRRIAEAGAAAAAVLLDGFDDRSEPPPADPNGAEVAAALAAAEVAERPLAEPLRQGRGRPRPAGTRNCRGGRNVVVLHAAELTGEYLDRRRELGEAARSVVGTTASSSSCSRFFRLARLGQPPRTLGPRQSSAGRPLRRGRVLVPGHAGGG